MRPRVNRKLPPKKPVDPQITREPHHSEKKATSFSETTSSPSKPHCSEQDSFAKDDNADARNLIAGESRVGAPTFVPGGSKRADLYEYRMACAESSIRMIEELDLHSGSRMIFLQEAPYYLSEKERHELWHQHYLHQVERLGQGSHYVRKSHIGPDYDARIKETRWGNCDEQAYLGAKYYTALSGRATKVIGSECKDDINCHSFWIDGLAEGANINDPSTWGDDAIIGDPWDHQAGAAKDRIQEMEQIMGPAQSYELMACIEREEPDSVRVTPNPKYNKDPCPSWTVPDSPRTIARKREME